jgi:DNA-binding transcriptional MocR family regulator
VQFTAVKPRDGYSPSNPTGYINLGTAVNCLCEDVILERFLRGDLWSHEPAWQHYTGLNGTEDLLRTAAGFLQERLAQGQPVSPEHLRMVNGVSAGLEVLSWVLADPEDLIIVPTPTYSRSYYVIPPNIK